MIIIIHIIGWRTCRLKWHAQSYRCVYIMYLFDVWGVPGACSGGPLIPGPRLLGGTGRGRLAVGGGTSGGLPAMTSSSISKILISFWDALRWGSVFDRSFFVLDSDWLLCEGAGSVNIQGLHTTTKEVMQKHTQTRGENPCQENKGRNCYYML